jgi:hypothetical protein
MGKGVHQMLAEEIAERRVEGVQHVTCRGIRNLTNA